jgi:archaellin
MRTFSTKKLVVTAAVAAVVVGTGTAAFAYWTSQGTGQGTATTAAEATTLVVKQTTSPVGMFPGDSEQKLVVKVTNPGPNKVQVDGVSVVPTVTRADGAEGKCDPSDYQVNGKQLPAEGVVSLNWDAVELDAEASQDSTNSVQFFDKDTSQDGCKGATLVLSYTAR